MTNNFFTDNSLTWRQALEIGKIKLQQQGIKTAMIDSQKLLQHIGNFQLGEFILCENETINEKQQKQFFNLIEKRQHHEPIARIIGKKQFYNIELEIAKDVFEPRPDTECLIDIILKNIDKQKSLYFADLGTGSGAIVLALLKNLPNAKAIATDISHQALAITAKNAKNLQLENRLDLQQGNWLDALYAKKINKIKFDFIVSNPPYIASDLIENLEKSTTYDPIIALDGGKNGLDIYKKLLKKIDFFLDKDGFFAYELGYDQAELLKNLSHKNGWKIQYEAKDIEGHVRSIICVKCKNNFVKNKV